jgi:hypothetical protein
MRVVVMAKRIAGAPVFRPNGFGVIRARAAMAG